MDLSEYNIQSKAVTAIKHYATNTYREVEVELQALTASILAGGWQTPWLPGRLTPWERYQIVSAMKLVGPKAGLKKVKKSIWKDLRFEINSHLKRITPYNVLMTDDFNLLQNLPKG